MVNFRVLIQHRSGQADRPNDNSKSSVSTRLPRTANRV